LGSLDTIQMVTDVLTGVIYGKPSEVRISKSMLILMTGLLYQIPNILCSLEKALGSMILAIDVIVTY